MAKPLEILVVEDREENRKAALDYFSTISDVIVDFATNYNDGLQKLQNRIYAAAIFDLELPRREGKWNYSHLQFNTTTGKFDLELPVRKEEAQPEKLGFNLADEATKYAVPWAVITSGRGHHLTEDAFVCYEWEKDRVLHEITEIPKTDSRAWKKVYETLIENNPNVAEEYEAKLRYKKRTGKMYTRK